jgi:hypothetical protein
MNAATLDFDIEMVRLLRECGREPCRGGGDGLGLPRTGEQALHLPTQQSNANVARLTRASTAKAPNVRDEVEGQTIYALTRVAVLDGARALANPPNLVARNSVGAKTKPECGSEVSMLSSLRLEFGDQP